MPQELLSTDPKAGLLSTDPSAGVIAASAPMGTRGGLSHPLTSVINPELEAVRGRLNAATAERPGDTQPVMARSRTGALYPSGVNTGGPGAIARGVAAGGGNAAITQAEGATSPLGMVAAAIPAAKAGFDQIAAAIENAPSVQRAVQIVKAMATDPDAIGIVSPRAGNAAKVAQKAGTVYTKAKDAVDARAATSAPAETAAAGGTPARPGPQPPGAQASTMSPQRVLNELAIQARRQGVKLSPQDYQAATEAVAQGVSPTDVVSALKQLQQPPDARAYMALRQAGKSNDEAMAALQGERDLAKRLGLPSTAEVEAAVKERNLTGRWKPKPKGDE